MATQKAVEKLIEQVPNADGYETKIIAEKTELLEKLKDMATTD